MLFLSLSSFKATGSSAVHEHLHDEDGALMFHVRGKKKKVRFVFRILVIHTNPTKVTGLFLLP